MSSILKAALLGIIIFCVTILLLVPVAFVFTGQDDGASSTVNPIEEKARNNIDIKSHHTTLPLQAEFYRLSQPGYNDSEAECPKETCEACVVKLRPLEYGYDQIQWENGKCDEELNNEMCAFDGGDCEITFCDYSVNDCLNNPLHQQGLISKFFVLLNELTIFLKHTYF